MFLPECVGGQEGGKVKKMVLFEKIRKFRRLLRGVSSPSPPVVEDVPVSEDKMVDLLATDLLMVDPKAAVVNVKMEVADEHPVPDPYLSDVKVPDEAKVEAVLSAAVLVGMALGAALLLQEAKKEAVKGRTAPVLAVPVPMFVPISVPAPVLVPVPVILPAPVEGGALVEATPAPVAAEAAPVPLDGPEQIFDSLSDEATDVPVAVPDEGGPVEATPVPVLVSVPAPDVVAPALVPVPALAPAPVPVPVLVPDPDESSPVEAASVPAVAPTSAPRIRHINIVEPPSWPIFSDRHEDYFQFEKDLQSFLEDFCADLREESKVMLIKTKCLSPKTFKEVNQLSTVEEILNWLHERFFSPILIIAKLMQPLRERYGVEPIDGTVVSEVLELYEYLYSIFYQVRKQRLWSAFSPDLTSVLYITARLPVGELGQWKMFSKSFPDRLRMSRLEFFVQERLTFYRETRLYDDYFKITCPTDQPSDVPKNVFRCRVPGCREDSYHSPDKCNVYLKLSVPSRLELLSTKKWCTVCLKHKQGKKCFASGKRKLPCGIGGCKEQHHHSLHVVIADVSNFSVLGAIRTEDAVVRKDTVNVSKNPLVNVPRSAAKVDRENQKVEVVPEVSNVHSIFVSGPLEAGPRESPVETQCCPCKLALAVGEKRGGPVEALSSPDEAGARICNDVFILGPREAESRGSPVEADCSPCPNTFVLGANEAEAHGVPVEAEDSPCNNVFYFKPTETEVQGGPVEAGQSQNWDGNMLILLMLFLQVWIKKILFLAGDCRMLFSQVLQFIFISMFLTSSSGGPAVEHCHGGGGDPLVVH